ncbi:MAG: GIY-YIG nuclease family protein [bacterium]|nr:GIY-YIG nuclease family protein [bacterium]
MYYVYILRLQNGNYYTGSTTDLKKRLQNHFQNSVQTTKNNKTEEVAFYAAFRSLDKARAFERYLKSSSGFAFRNQRLI